MLFKKLLEVLKKSDDYLRLSQISFFKKDDSTDIYDYDITLPCGKHGKATFDIYKLEFKVTKNPCNTCHFNCYGLSDLDIENIFNLLSYCTIKGVK
jgi:hypothetical protein